MYYNTPDPNDLRYPEPTQNVDPATDSASNFSAAIAAYADVEEAAEDEELLEWHAVAGDDFDDIPF